MIIRLCLAEHLLHLKDVKELARAYINYHQDRIQTIAPGITKLQNPLFPPEQEHYVVLDSSGNAAYIINPASERHILYQQIQSQRKLKTTNNTVLVIPFEVEGFFVIAGPESDQPCIVDMVSYVDDQNPEPFAQVLWKMLVTNI